MLPILQSGGFATLQAPASSDGTDNHEATKDFSRSDRFSSLVRDSKEDSKTDTEVAEIADEETVVEVADEASFEGKDIRRQAEGDRDQENSDVRYTALEGVEETGATKIKTDGPAIPANTEDAHPLSRSRPADHTNNVAPTHKMISNSIEPSPDIKVVPRQVGLDMGIEPGRSNVPQGTIVAELGIQQNAQVATSNTQATAQPALGDALELPSAVARQGLSGLRVRDTSSASQSILRSAAGAGAEFGSAAGVASEARPTQQVQTEAVLTGTKSPVGKKHDPILGSERPIATTQNQPTPPTSFAIEPRQVPQIARSNGDSRIRSANDLTDLTAETEVPQGAKKSKVAGLAFAPLATSELAATGQKAATSVGSDELLRAGFAATTDNIIQSTQVEAAPRGTQVPATELPRHIARQLAEVSQRMPDRPVEVSLNPEELGRVRMSISAHDTRITMSLLAERQETLDLMRRHIDQLTQEFHALGFGDVRFSFSQKEESANEHSDSMRDDSSAHSEHASAEAPIKLSLNPSAGLDLRL